MVQKWRSRRERCLRMYENEERGVSQEEYRWAAEGERLPFDDVDGVEDRREFGQAGLGALARLPFHRDFHPSFVDRARHIVRARRKRDFAAVTPAKFETTGQAQGPQYAAVDFIPAELTRGWTTLFIGSLLCAVPEAMVWAIPTPSHLPKPCAICLTRNTTYRPPGQLSLCFAAYESYDDSRQGQGAPSVQYAVFRSSSGNASLDRMQSLSLPPPSPSISLLTTARTTEDYIPPRPITPLASLLLHNLPKDVDAETLRDYLPPFPTAGIVINNSDNPCSGTRTGQPHTASAFLLFPSLFPQ
ncbi:hypothetical protein JCM11641_006311 [Rhodosporidiobolus odoratus]